MDVAVINPITAALAAKPAGPVLVDLDDGTVLDIRTRLVWKKECEPEKFTWDDAVAAFEGDAATVGVGDATVVFVFLPPQATCQLLPGLLDQLGRRGRVIAHEQLAINWPIEPERSQLIVGTGVTVAHIWSGRLL